MPFYTRHPLDTLLLSDPFFTSFLSPAHHNTPSQQRSSSTGATGDSSEHEHHSIRAFSPNFDVHETQKEYILEGELPGLDDKKKNLAIEFTDTNTLVVRGKIERSYTAGTPPGKRLEGVQMKGAIKEGGEKEKEKEKAGEQQQQEQKGDEDEEKVKYWVSERTVGSFQRSFSFPGEVDQDNVKASLEHGILKIVVPKKERRGTKKIDIA